MSSGGDRKRGHDAVSDETDTSVRRLTKQLKPPPAPPSAEPRPPCFLDLPAGIVANIARFIDIGEVDEEGISVRNGEILLYLCLVFGRQTARVIRREYLSNNLLYLDYIFAEVEHHADRVVGPSHPIIRCTDKERCSKGIANLNGALGQWMQANKWWKDACRDAAVFAKGGDVCTKNPPIFKTNKVKSYGYNNWAQWNDALETGPSSHIEIYYASDLVDLYFDGGPSEDDYTIVLAVDEIDLTNHAREMTWDQVEEVVLKEGDKNLRVMHSTFAAMLLNPALAIDLGMFELFRFQVEDLMLDVNCQDYAGLFFADTGFNDDFQQGQSLLLHVLINPDRRFFEYLLSVANFEANPIIRRDVYGRLYMEECTFLHELSRITPYELPNNIDLSWVAHMIKVKEIDLNVQNAAGRSPLERLCYFCSPQESMTKRDYDVAKMLLSAGAEVTDFALQSVGSGLKNLKHQRQNGEVFDFLELLESYRYKDQPAQN